MLDFTFAESLGHSSLCQRCQLFIINGRIYDRRVDQLALAAMRRADVFNDTFHCFRQQCVDFLGVAAGRADQFCGIGDDVPAGTALERADRDDRRILRVDLTADDLLQFFDDRTAGSQCIDTLLRCGAVAALALDLDLEQVCTCHDRTRCDRDITAVDVSPYMQCEAGVYALEQTFLDHQLRALTVFLRKLEA